MHYLYSVLLAAVILYVAPIIANPLASVQSQGGTSVHFKTVEEGIWPYQRDDSDGRAQNADVSRHQGYWI
jgi:hypothetical protein